MYAAVLSLGDGVVLVGTTAAWWRKLHGAPPVILDLAVPRGTRPAARRGVRLHHRDVAPEDRVVVDGVAVSTGAVTVLDAAVDLGLVAGARLVDRALQRGAVVVDALRWARASRTGRSGTELTRRLIAWFELVSAPEKLIEVLRVVLARSSASGE